MNCISRPMQACLVAMTCITLSGCETLVDLDRPIAPEHLMWTKGPGSQEKVHQALRECGRQIQSNKELMSSGSSKAIGDFSDACMLQKGFTFVPRPEGYRNLCIPDGAFWHGIACKSYRGEYTPPLTEDLTHKYGDISGPTMVKKESPAPTGQARIRVFHGPRIDLHLGDVCGDTKPSTIHASVGGFSFLVQNKTIGMPPTDDMPFSYHEFAIPAGIPITVEGFWQAQAANGTWERCGPIYVKFTPGIGVDYDVAMKITHGICDIQLRTLTTGTDGKAIPSPARLDGEQFTKCPSPNR